MCIHELAALACSDTFDGEQEVPLTRVAVVYSDWPLEITLAPGDVRLFLVGVCLSLLLFLFPLVVVHFILLVLVLLFLLLSFFLP